MFALRADSPIQYLKGIGPARAELFARAGLRTVADLLHYFPFRHEAPDAPVEIADLRPGTKALIRGEIQRVAGRRGSRTALVHDGSDACTLRWFNEPFELRGLQVGASVIARGIAREYKGRLEIVQPQVQLFAPGAVMLAPASSGRQVGVYRAAGELRSLLIRRAVQAVLAQPRLPIEPIAPPELLRRRALLPREPAVRAMHQPADAQEFEQARRTLAYEEFLLIELALALRRRHSQALQTAPVFRVTAEIDRRIRARFPFALTDAQNRALREICADLASGRPMSRLLQGDVGSGKTVVALYAALVAVAHGRQAAIMAPTELLARQHYDSLQRYLAGSRVRHELLHGGQKRAERAAARAAIRAHQLDLVVGTQALLEADVAFADLGLVVVDEQHKFGVVQRAEIRTKGPRPHYLVMTATPIPRTLSMTVYGDLDVSVLRQSPPGRGRVTTRVVGAAQWDTVMSYARKRLERGERAYVVCPLIGGAEPPTGAEPAGAGSTGGQRKPAALRSASQTLRRLETGPWRGLKLALLHGGLPLEEKRRVTEAFRAGALHALIATTVVEVGVDVPDASLMLVEHAERFGLSQLHQLRGRIGRGARDSLCVLIAYEQRGGPSRSAERLAILAETTDGFRIAEADLRQRGPGELLGTRQHGLPELRVGDLLGDFALLEQARDDAFELAQADPALRRPEHRPLVPALRQMFGDKLALLDAG